MKTNLKINGGYTLVELIVAVGLFATVMLLVSGAYLMMIGVNQQTQNISTGIDNLSFAIETMTHDIRVGTGYTCPGGVSDCTIDATSGSFSFKNENGIPVSYSLLGSAITKTTAGVSSYLTSAATVTVTSLTFYVTGTKTASQGDVQQSRTTISVTGTVSSGTGKAPQYFTVETGATMRGSDI